MNNSLAQAIRMTWANCSTLCTT